MFPTPQRSNPQPSDLQSDFICQNICLFVCVEVLQSNQPNGVMSSEVSLPYHGFYWESLVL